MEHRKKLAEFELPLNVCPTENRASQQAGGLRAGLRKRCREIMTHQALVQGIALWRPFPRGILIRCTRHSDKRTDSTGWDKIPIDCLLPSVERLGKRIVRLGLIEDDSPDVITRVHAHQHAKRREGKVTVEIFGPSSLVHTQLLRELESRLPGVSDEMLLHMLDMVSK